MNIFLLNCLYIPIKWPINSFVLHLRYPSSALWGGGVLSSSCLWIHLFRWGSSYIIHVCEMIIVYTYIYIHIYIIIIYRASQTGWHFIRCGAEQFSHSLILRTKKTTSAKRRQIQCHVKDRKRSEYENKTISSTRPAAMTSRHSIFKALHL